MLATVGDRLPVRQVLEGMLSEGLEDLDELADDGAEVAEDRDVFARGKGRKVGSGKENNIKVNHLRGSWGLFWSDFI